MRAIVTIGFVMVLICLAVAGYFMLRSGPKDRSKNSSKPSDEQAAAAPPQTQRQIERNRRMAKVLGWRVAISAILFCFVLLSWQMNWLAPNTYQG